MKNTGKTLNKKLSLNKNTLRQLAGNDLSQAVGGRPPETANSQCADCHTYWGECA